MECGNYIEDKPEAHIAFMEKGKHLEGVGIKITSKVSIKLLLIT